jgi:iron complex outermembrane recepter protein
LGETVSTTAARSIKAPASGAPGESIIWAYIAFSLAVAGTPRTGGAQEAQALPEITVTAQKVTENMQDVPISISALTANDIEQAQITTIKDAAALFPNVHVSNIGSDVEFTSLAIRGLSNNFATPTLRAAVLVDDVPYASTRSLSSALFDVQQMELLRGPQSTLFGLTAEAGVLVVKTVRPRTDSWGGNVSVNAATEGEYEAQLNLSGPVIDHLWSAGISGYWSHDDGFIKNVLTDEDFNRSNSAAVRVRSVFQPNDAWAIDLVGEHQEIRDGYGQVMLPLNIASFNTDFRGVNGFQGNVGRFDTAQDYQGFSRLETSGASLRAQYSGFSDFDVVLVSAFRDAIGRKSADLGMTPAPWLPAPDFPIFAGGSDFDSRDFSQEIRLASHTGSRALTWVLGGYYYHNDSDLKESINLTEPIDASGSSRYSGALFGNVKYAFDNGLALTGGLRYEHAVARGHQDFNTFNPDTGGLAAQVNDSIVLPRWILDYHLSKDTMGYVSVARGWLPGGVSISSPQHLTFSPEKMWNYELGGKSLWLNGRVRLNVALFDAEIRDYQETTRQDVITPIISNADRVRIQGAEAELGIAVLEGLDLAVGWGVNDAKYTSFRNSVEDNTGNKVPGVPRYNGSVVLTYQLPRGFYARGEWIAVGRSHVLEDRQNIYPELAAYSVLNLQWGIKTSRWSAFLYLNNAFDKRYFTAAFDQLNDGRLLGAVGRNRQFGIHTRYDF